MAIAEVRKSPFSIFYRTYRARCGHITRLCGQMGSFGQSVTIRITTNKDGSVDFCVECLENMAIQCAECARPIFIGQPVILGMELKGFQYPKNAARHSSSPVCCLRKDCAEAEDTTWIPALTLAFGSRNIPEDFSSRDPDGYWAPGENGRGYVSPTPP